MTASDVQMSSSIPDRRVQAGPTRLPRPALIGLWIMGLASLLVGLQQQFAPLAFYDSFPGFGMRWVAVDGPYNEHLLRDLGGANLALAVLTFFAIARPSAGLVRAVAAATLVAQLPHFAYHATRLAVLETDRDRVLQTIVLAFVILVPLLVLVAAREIGGDAAGSRQTRSTAVPGNDAGAAPMEREAVRRGALSVERAPLRVADPGNATAHRDG